MAFLQIAAILTFHHLLTVESTYFPIKRPEPDVPLSPPPKHSKVDTDFLSKFRDSKVHSNIKIPHENIVPFLGHGGTYEAVQPLVSKSQTVESDHIPHYSILDYLDKVDKTKLPENIRNVVETRNNLQEQLQKTDYPKNEEKLKILEKERKALQKNLDKVVRVSKWEKSLQKKYTSNVQQISETLRNTEELKERLKVTPGDTTLASSIANNEHKVKQLMKKNSDIRAEAKKEFKTPVQAKFLEVEAEYIELKTKNMYLSKDLRVHNDNIKKAMGVLSVPYDAHRQFPTTGSAGLDEEIRGLKNADAATAKSTMQAYDKAWSSNMEEGIKKGYLKVSDDWASITNGKKTYNLQKVWEGNFAIVSENVASKPVTKGTPKKGSKTTGLRTETKADYMERLYKTYKKKFITTSIYYIKTPEAGYSRLLNLYIDEYKVYLKNDFEAYKVGVSKLLEANKDFGWLADDEVKKLKNDHKLTTTDTDTSSQEAVKRANQWNEVEELIRLKNDKTTNPIINRKTSATSRLEDKKVKSVVCSSSSRKKRSADDGCIFFSKRNHENDLDSDVHKPKSDVEESRGRAKPKVVDTKNPKVRSNIDSTNTKARVNLDTTEFDGLSKPQIHLPSDADTTSIDSKRLTTYLSQLDDGDMNSASSKSSIVEYASRNSDKLTGSPEEIARAKAILKQENLNSHSQQNALARGALRNDGSIPPKALTKFQKVKVSANKFAAKAGKFTTGSGKVGGSYGKIMLAKGVVTALRHGDYESLAMIGGRIGLGFALKGVTKLGERIARKSTTKFMTKFGSNFLGKLAGPVGDLADIGMNVYSITKAVKRLNDPNASKFDQNDAIADLVADGIDIAVTATAAVLSLVFPPLAPFFGAVAFIVNVLTTFIVAFYKAANHVDRLNDEIPLLGYEKTNEYFRYLGGRDTSGYIQDLIDTKRANNIIVNMTVQFLINNPDYIGRVSPSQTMYNPKAKCYLQRKSCGNTVFYIPIGCVDWKWVSDCDGYGEYCEGSYSSWKCQSESKKAGVKGLASAYYEYRCKCGTDPPPQWGYEILDQEVDFREKQNVYLQRAAPDFLVPSGFQYKCKPSSLQNEGNRVSNSWTSYEYLCKGAIAVMRSYGGKFMLYDLGNGTDKVYLDQYERVDNLFIIQEGDKTFYGNAGDDTFVFSGPCNNLEVWLKGYGYRDQGNSIVFEENCARGEKIEVNLRTNRMKFGTGSRNVDYIYDINRVIGRKEGQEVIYADCSTKFIAGGGGRSSIMPDWVYVPSCIGNMFDLTVSAEKTTTIDASNFSEGKVFTLLKGQPAFIAKVPHIFGGTLIFKFEDISGNLDSAKVEKIGTLVRIQLGFSNYASAWFEFTGNSPGRGRQASECESGRKEGSQITILISESNKFNRQLIYDLEEAQVQCFFRLDLEARNVGGSSIQGYNFMQNVFHLKSGSWTVTGGSLNDQFFLIGSDFSGSIDGGSGQNSLRITNENQENLEVNLNSGFIRGRNTIYMRNIQEVIYRRAYTERVTTACTTKSLDLGGTAHDHVDIPALSCTVDIALAVLGNIVIVDRKLAGSATIQAGYANIDGCSKAATPALSLTASHIGGGQMTLLLNFPIYKLLTATILHLNIDGGHFVHFPEKFPSVYFEEGNNLKSVLIKQEGQLMAFHELNTSGSSRRGTSAIPNVFKLEGGRDWNIVGGSLEDTFSLVSDLFHGVIDGANGKNSLFIDDAISGTAKISFNDVLMDGSQILSFQNIQEFHGRSQQPEHIQLACEMQFVGMNGGMNLGNPDIVMIPNINCASKTTVVAMGYTNFQSESTGGFYDIYFQEDPSQNLKVKSAIHITDSTIFNLPIQVPTVKLSSYDLTFEDEQGFKKLTLQLKFTENNNFVEFHYQFDLAYFEDQIRNVNMMFIDEEFNSDGNILINAETKDMIILHVLQTTNSSSDETLKVLRRGATGAKNIFRLNTGNWGAFGGTFDDSFILNDDNFQGTIHGLRGVNSLILSDSLTFDKIIVNLLNKSLTMDSSSPSVIVNSIQIVGGRKLKGDEVICACDTKLVMLEGGASWSSQDEIKVEQSFCRPTMSFVVSEFTRVENKASAGNFTYHVKTSKKYEIIYTATLETNHAFKFEIPLNQVKNAAMLNTTLLQITFENDVVKEFTLNFENPPTFTFGEGEELLAQLSLDSELSPQYSIIARSPFSGNIHGINGVENRIIVQTSGSLESVVGGDKDDTFFLLQVQSAQLIDGREGTNRLQLSDELHSGKELEIDLNEGRIEFLEEDTDPLVTALKGFTLLAGRENGFESVILGCDTASVKFADEIIVRQNCGYSVRMEVGPGTRVIFEVEEKEDPLDTGSSDMENEDEEGSFTVEVDDTINSVVPTRTHEDEALEAVIPFDRNLDEDYDEEEEEEVPEEMLEPSTFYYHFTTLTSFDIEVDSFSQLAHTRHIYYLNFSISDLSTISFSVADSRLIYSTVAHSETEYSHLVGEVKDSALFYSQPEFMTAEGFLLRVSRYGEIMGVVANPQESLELKTIQEDLVPRLSAYASRLGISFIVETGSDFIYVGNPNEVDVLTNRENVTSHLVGFDQTTYEVLDLDNDIFIYPQFDTEDLSAEGSQQVLDLSDIVFQIRNRTGQKYIPTVVQSKNDLEIVMDNWTDVFAGKVILVNGTLYRNSLSILLNSIAMEILPNGGRDQNGSRSKRSTEDRDEWAIKPCPISIPDGHVYLFSAEDLEDEVEVRRDSENDDNSTFGYGKADNDLIVTSTSTKDLETGAATSFIIFDYYNPTSTILEGSEQDQNETSSSFGKVESVNSIHLKLGTEPVKITSNEPPVSDDTGEEIQIQFYEDILDREEAEILKDFPDMPRKLEVSWQRKIGRTVEYRYAVWAIFFFVTIIVGSLIYKFCRKRTVKGKYLVEKCEKNGVITVLHEDKQLLPLNSFYEESIEEYDEPRLITEITLTETM